MLHTAAVLSFADQTVLVTSHMATGEGAQAQGAQGGSQAPSSKEEKGPWNSKLNAIQG
jgi:hypothetical protein